MLSTTNPTNGAAQRGSGFGGPASATARSVEVFGRTFGALNKLRREAEQQGERVVRSSVRLEYAPYGRALAARSGRAVFDSKPATPPPSEAARSDDARKADRQPQAPAAARSSEKADDAPAAAPAKSAAQTPDAERPHLDTSA